MIRFIGLSNENNTDCTDLHRFWVYICGNLCNLCYKTCAGLFFLVFFG